MALSIIYNSGITSNHLIEDANIPNEDIQFITEIRASGEELKHIQSSFRVEPLYPTPEGFHRPVHIYNIPMPNLMLVRWYGDVAKTIVGNLFSH